MSDQYFQFLFRKKRIDNDNLGETKLARVLNTLDLTALGVGSTLGAGIYVLAGSVIKNVSGPSVILSFIVAAIASVLAGLCYAEFGARVPKTGSAYVYTYVTIGEFLAFIIGWNLILEYVIGTSSVARAFSTYFDSLVDKKIATFFREYLPMNITGLSPYPDFFAFAITLLITAVLALGVKESSRMNNIFTGVNLCVVTFIIVFGSIKANFNNWSIDSNTFVNTTFTNSSTACNETYQSCGSGGFFPFGFSGMLAGAAKCFYAFVGFDCIATTGEEVKNPQRAIPISIIFALLICTVAYCGVSAVLSLMVPYYMIDENAPMPEAFRFVGWNWARYLVAIGAICSLSTSLLGAMFPLPRVLYAISSDGLIFRSLSKINERFKTPLFATIVSGLFAAFMAMIFDLDELVNMMSIGTLLAYSLVALSVLILRYENESSANERRLINRSDSDENLNQTLFQKLFAPPKNPNKNTSRTVNILAGLCCIDIVIVCLILILAEHKLDEIFVIVLLVFFSLIGILLIFSIYRQPQNTKTITFQMPLVPFLPLMSIFINFYLMLVLNTATWIRFGVWMIIGFIIYFGYGIWNSTERMPYNRLNTESDMSSASSSESLNGEGENRSNTRDL